jgi:HEAT repeat protein
VQDAWLSAYLDPLPLDVAATVVLDVARCWGGDYRERAVEALSMGKRSVLEQVASYLGDPVMDWVAQSILLDAGQKAVPVLVRKLRSKDEPVWTGAWTVIASMGSGDIGQGLVPLLEDPDPELRIRALKLYGNSMPAGSHPELLPLLDDPDLMVRRWALATVGMLGVQDAVPRLMQYARSSKTPPGVLAEALFSLGLLEVHEAVPEMVEGAGHQSTEVRESVALALGNVGADGVLQPLLGLLGDDEPTVVLNAIQSVGILANEDAIPYLEGLVESPHPALAEASWLAIERIRAANTVSLAELDDEAVEQVCGELGAEQLSDLAKNPGKEAMSCLLKKLKSKDHEVREAACVALGERGDPKAMGLLKKRTKDKKPGVRKAAWAALEILDKIKKKKKKKKKSK